MINNGQAGRQARMVPEQLSAQLNSRSTQQGACITDINGQKCINVHKCAGSAAWCKHVIMYTADNNHYVKLATL